jgi:hypothetical protein
MEDNRTAGFWVGWVIFASVMMWLVGAFQIIAGITALTDPQGLVVTDERLLAFDLTVWGWIHIVLGTVVIFAGIGVRGGAVWARTVGIALAGLSALSNLAYAPAQTGAPVLIVAIDILIIYALARHARGRT